MQLIVQIYTWISSLIAIHPGEKNYHPGGYDRESSLLWIDSRFRENDVEKSSKKNLQKNTFTSIIEMQWKLESFKKFLYTEWHKTLISKTIKHVQSTSYQRQYTFYKEFNSAFFDDRHGICVCHYFGANYYSIKHR